MLSTDRQKFQTKKKDIKMEKLSSTKTKISQQASVFGLAAGFQV